jgi:biotin carboxyl carrier protein
MKKKIIYRGREFIVEPVDDHIIEINGEKYKPDVFRQTESQFKVNIDGYSFNLEYKDGKIYLEGEELEINIKPYIGKIAVGSRLGDRRNKIIRAPISGKITQILIVDDSQIEKDQEILILEAMKMRNRIFSPISGHIIEIYVKPGDNVDQDDKLVKIKPISNK